MKKLLAPLALCLSIAMALLPLASFAEAITYEGPGWDTPEEAVAFYLEAFRDQDLHRAISAYALETLVDHADFAAQLQRTRVYIASQVPNMPNANEMIRALNIEARQNEITRIVLYQILSVCNTGIDITTPVSFKSDAPDKEIALFARKLESALVRPGFSTLELITFVPPGLVSEHYMLERNHENMATQAALYGADEMRSVIAVFELSRKVYVLCCDALRYDEAWYLYRAPGTAGQLLSLSPASGGVVLLPEEFEEQLAEFLAGQ